MISLASGFYGGCRICFIYLFFRIGDDVGQPDVLVTLGLISNIFSYFFRSAKMMNESTNYNTTSYTPINATALPKWDNSTATGKSFSEALILASTNPKYDKRLFIDSPGQYMKTTSSELVMYINCFFVFV